MLCLQPFDVWSGKGGSNSRPQPWQGCALPLSYSRLEDAHFSFNVFFVKLFFAVFRILFSLKSGQSHLINFRTAFEAASRPTACQYRFWCLAQAAIFSLPGLWITRSSRVMTVQERMNILVTLSSLARRLLNRRTSNTG